MAAEGAPSGVEKVKVRQGLGACLCMRLYFLSSPSPLQASHTAEVDGKGLRVGIVHARWNRTVVDALVKGAQDELEASGASVVLQEVPGSYELPFGAKCLINGSGVDAVIAVGCLIKGDTKHFEYICEAVTQGIMRVQLDTDTPVVFGVLTCTEEAQATLRAGLVPGKAHMNHGPDWGRTALTMARLAKASHLHPKLTK